MFWGHTHVEMCQFRGSVPGPHRISRRAVWLWILIHAAVVLIRLAARLPPLGEPSTKQAVIVAAVIGTLSWLEIRRRNEDLFLANLGVAPARLYLHALIPPFLLELALRMLVPT